MPHDGWNVRQRRHHSPFKGTQNQHHQGPSTSKLTPLPKCPISPRRLEQASNACPRTLQIKLQHCSAGSFVSPAVLCSTAACILLSSAVDEGRGSLHGQCLTGQLFMLYTHYFVIIITFVIVNNNFPIYLSMYPFGRNVCQCLF